MYKVDIMHCKVVGVKEVLTTYRVDMVREG